eukprot:CAMPEP_0177263086 /NCGR_PEP_ID=MMETSP0367-20130122/60788_1 /TAXON_ID=447022 ORGANISM="Scrippsiella hangoei-like, Strain SHHI-4" /NCGR_SAMPLE_ID=MMETSP0367 /ASSEMBLY_ACC=CAM_ASM_000362 /LENGTH=79 /DNA_ID=CAMNT_0018718015 /DNA_START=267 /DNA_END=502 /DNA_ORIENTATION=+
MTRVTFRERRKHEGVTDIVEYASNTTANQLTHDATAMKHQKHAKARPYSDCGDSSPKPMVVTVNTAKYKQSEKSFSLPP